MTVYVGSRGALSGLSFGNTSFAINGMEGWYLSSKGNAIPAKNDTALWGVFMGLQRAVNSYLSRYPVTAETLKVDGIIGEITLRSTQAVVGHMGTALERPPSISFLAKSADRYSRAIAGALDRRPDQTPPPAGSTGTVAEEEDAATSTGGQSMTVVTPGTIPPGTKPPAPTPTPGTTSTGGGKTSMASLGGIALFALAGYVLWSMKKKKG